MRATFTDFFNAGHDLHFRQSRVKLFGIFALCVAVTMALAAIGYDWAPNSFSEWSRWKFQFMALLFALVTVFPLYQLANAHKKGIVLTKTGVTDHRISSRQIPWLRIDAVSEGKRLSSRFIVLRLADAGDAPRNVLQNLNGMALGLQNNERMISTAGLDASHQMLVEAFSAGWRAARQPRPPSSASNTKGLRRS